MPRYHFREMCGGHVEGMPPAAQTSFPSCILAVEGSHLNLSTGIVFSQPRDSRSQHHPQGSTHPGPTSLSSGHIWRAIVDGGISRSPCCIIAQLLPYPDLHSPGIMVQTLLPSKSPAHKSPSQARVCSPGIPAKDRRLFPSQLAIPRI